MVGEEIGGEGRLKGLGMGIDRGVELELVGAVDEQQAGVDGGGVLPVNLAKNGVE